jgi:hypothetical protein
MGEQNGVGRTNKVDIFSMFRQYRDFSITDNDGNTFGFVMKTMSFKETQAMLDGIQQAQLEARKKYDTEEMRGEYRHQTKGVKRERIIEDIISAEKPVVQSVADLAPTVTDDERKRVEQEEAAVNKWEAERREELGPLDDDALVNILIDRRIADMISMGGNLAFMDQNIAAMVLDPDTRQPILSANKLHDNFIGHLTPQMRRELMTIWQNFVKEGNEKGIRKAAEDGSFLSSGDSEKSSENSPGETSSTPANSPESSSPSTPNASGSTV